MATSLNITVMDRYGKLLHDFKNKEIKADSTVEELKKILIKTIGKMSKQQSDNLLEKLSTDRVYLTLDSAKGTVLSDRRKKISDYSK